MTRWPPHCGLSPPTSCHVPDRNRDYMRRHGTTTQNHTAIVRLLIRLLRRTSKAQQGIPSNSASFCMRMFDLNIRSSRGWVQQLVERSKPLTKWTFSSAASKMVLALQSVQRAAVNKAMLVMRLFNCLAINLQYAYLVGNIAAHRQHPSENVFLLKMGLCTSIMVLNGEAGQLQSLT